MTGYSNSIYGLGRKIMETIGKIRGNSNAELPTRAVRPADNVLFESLNPRTGEPVKVDYVQIDLTPSQFVKAEERGNVVPTVPRSGIDSSRNITYDENGREKIAYRILREGWGLDTKA